MKNWAVVVLISANIFLVGAVGCGVLPNRSAQEQPSPVPKEQGITLAAYLAQRPEIPTGLTLDCRLTNYYNYAYKKSAATHHCIVMSSEHSAKRGHAWVRKDSEVGRLIFEALKDGERHHLTVEVVLQGPDGTPTPLNREEMAVVGLVK